MNINILNYFINQDNNLYNNIYNIEYTNCPSYINLIDKQLLVYNSFKFMIDENDLIKKHNTRDDSKKKSKNSIFTKIKHYFYPSSNYDHGIKIYDISNIETNDQNKTLLSTNNLNMPLHTIYKHEQNSNINLKPLLCPVCYRDINICDICKSSSKKNKHSVLHKSNIINLDVYPINKYHVLHKPDIFNDETSPRNKNVVRFNIETQKINYLKLKPLLCSICLEYKNKCICSIF